MNYAEMLAVFYRRGDGQPTHYAILDVTPEDCKNAERLTAARRAVALVMHPDRRPDDAFAALYMSRANLAFDVLTDAGRHKMYRLHLRSTHGECAACHGLGGKHRQRGFKAKEFHRCAACGGEGWVPKETTK